MANLKASYRVDVGYPSSEWPEGDTKLQRIAGKPSGASGMGFGQRDVTFFYDTSREANAVANKIRSRCKFVTSVDVSMEED